MFFCRRRRNISRTSNSVQSYTETVHRGYFTVATISLSDTNLYRRWVCQNRQYSFLNDFFVSQSLSAHRVLHIRLYSELHIPAYFSADVFRQNYSGEERSKQNDFSKRRWKKFFCNCIYLFFCCIYTFEQNVWL